MQITPSLNAVNDDDNLVLVKSIGHGHKGSIVGFMCSWCRIWQTRDNLQWGRSISCKPDANANKFRGRQTKVNKFCSSFYSSNSLKRMGGRHTYLTCGSVMKDGRTERESTKGLEHWRNTLCHNRHVSSSEIEVKRSKGRVNFENKKSPPRLHLSLT